MKRALVLFAAIAFMLGGAAAFSQDKGTAAAALPKGKWVIALSNSYYGNTWRKQMVEAFNTAAQEAKKQGLIKDYIVVNGDGTQNTQIAQMNSLILKGVDVICINAASPTALNGVIEQAAKKGIKVIAFDSIADSPFCYKMDFDFVMDGVMRVDYVAKRLNGEGNVIQILGVSGSAPAIQMHQGQNDELKKFPGLKVVAKVEGEASASVAQQNTANVLPSLPKVDAVLTQAGNDSYGVVQAFEASGKPMPLILGDGTSEFLQWWLQQKKANNYETISVGSAPGIGGAAFWVGLAILNKVNVPMSMQLPLSVVTQDDVEKYSNLKPGMVVSPDFTYQYVLDNVINKK
jgi:ribose transport system substrate-binding protein